MSLTTREFRDNRRLRPVLAGVAAVVAVAALCIPFACNEDSPVADPRSGAAPSVPASSAAAAATTAAKGSLVPAVPVSRSASDPDWLTAPPQGISWQRVEGVPLPFTASDGPTAIDGAVASGYAHTPQGAAIAALQISMRMLYSPDFARVVAEQTDLPQSERSKILTARAANPRLAASAVQASTVQPAGFKLGAYSDESATVYYAYPRRDATYRVARMAVVWKDGDWRYTNRFGADAHPDITDLTGFTPL